MRSGWASAACMRRGKQLPLSLSLPRSLPLSCCRFSVHVTGTSSDSVAAETVRHSQRQGSQLGKQLDSIEAAAHECVSQVKNWREVLATCRFLHEDGHPPRAPAVIGFLCFNQLLVCQFAVLCAALMKFRLIQHLQSAEASFAPTTERGPGDTCL